MKKILLSAGFILIAFLVRSQTTVSFYAADSFRLDGTLTLPDNVNQPPVLILVHGSGQVNRDSEVQITGQPNFPCIYPELVGHTSRFFKDIADSLATAGIAVLRYDKRTTRPAEVDVENLTVYDFARDAAAAVEFLQNREDVDTSNIFLLGHSQGSSVTAWLAMKNSRVKGVISAAGSSSRIDSLYANQVFRIQAECNNDSAGGELQRIQILAAMQQIRSGAIADSIPVMGAYPPFWRSWMNISDSAVYLYKNTKMPVLVLQGDDDFNVPVEEADRYKNIDPSRVDVHILEGINHFFNNGQTVKTDSLTLELIIEFILSNKETTSIFEQEGTLPEFYKLYRERNRVRFVNETADVMQVNWFDLYGRRLGGSSAGAKGELGFDLNRSLTLVNIRAGSRVETIKMNAVR